LIPLGIAFFCLASVVDTVGRSEWAKFYAISAATFGTFALTFVATLNNHLPGFVCISIALWAGVKILVEGRRSGWYFALAGFFGAFAVACELPALAFAVALCATLLVKTPKKTALFAVPCGLAVALAFVATNYAAHETWRPAYSCKRDHMKIAAQLAETPEAERAAAAFDAFEPSDWYYYNYYLPGKDRLPQNVRLSHWANRTGIDRGEPSIARYAFHSTIGSRGVFSLTPIWLFAVAGFGVWALGRKPTDGASLRWLGLTGLALTAVFFAFFLTRDQGDRNYGGMSCCPRWFFPLVPLMTPALCPIADRLGRSRAARVVAYLALAISALSAAYPTWTPWTSPWLYDLATAFGWMKGY
ncbi:MAG: hypothetical protein HUK22_00655, partial [Thermoguttaceae bacterium]|nr:hypothetical protein [Thermoguttaceae bacterium]